MWIERWRAMTAGEIDYATYQDAADRFPEIPREQFQRAVVFVDEKGEVFTAAKAVFQSLACRSSCKWMIWSYANIPGFAAISEFAYKIVARNRPFSSAVTRLLWGEDVRPPTYFWARKWFLRALGLVYLVAFVSLWVQVDGLIGANGLSPVREFLPAAREQLGANAPFVLPTLCWLNSSNAFLHFLCGAGAFVSILLIAEIVPVISLIALFVLYLSLTIAGQTFLSFQWDILLLEAGFLAIFFAPWQLWRKHDQEPPFSRLGFLLLKLLLFKLMLMSGVVKLTSGDESWGWVGHSWHWNLATALDYHYWSQPLPTIFAWWTDKSAGWFKHFSVAFCLVVEIIVPFFIWTPRRPRLIACGLLIFLQLVIALTGNYCFFNLLTIALCLLLIDDASFAKIFRRASPERDPRRTWAHWPAGVILIVTLPLNALLVLSAFRPEITWPRPLAKLYRHVESFRIANGYGLFRVMTKERNEIVLEGSADGIDWLPYEFKWKPGDVMRAPAWCAPHQPRLDWQMWFAAFETYRENPWFVGLAIQLLKGSPDVGGFFAHNPFPQKPPRYIRATLYDYRFTTTAEHQQSGAWWKRRELREYLPAISLENVR
jgi:predicted DCC family thiol-disulfide oxidoreductase YuxK